MRWKEKKENKGKESQEDERQNEMMWTAMREKEGKGKKGMERKEDQMRGEERGRKERLCRQRRAPSGPRHLPALASVPRVTQVCSEVANKSPSSPRTCSCQSTLCTWCLTRGYLVTDTPVQLFATAGQKAAGLEFHLLQVPPSLSPSLHLTPTPAPRLAPLIYTGCRFRRSPGVSLALSAAGRAEDCSPYWRTDETQGSELPNHLFAPPGRVRCKLLFKVMWSVLFL